VKGTRADAMPKDKNGEVNVGELFRQRLESTGVSVEDAEVPAAKLKASQNELKGANVGFMMSPEGSKAIGLDDTRIFVSSDGYVIDGHHRWAAQVGLDASDGSLGDRTMKVTVIDMPISEVLDYANNYADEIGIAPKAAKARGPLLKHQSHDQSTHGRRNGVSGYGSPDNPPAESNRPADVVAAAKATRAKAVAAEPQITQDMVDMASKHGGELVGLDYRLKSEKSLARKIDDEKAELGGDVEATAAKMSDVVRYTAVFDDANYVDGVQASISDLEGQNYEMRVKNYWQSGDPYQGINVAAVHPGTGQKFELQFHTPDSYGKKEPIHQHYETYRTSKDTRTRWKSYNRMVRMAYKIAVPSGAVLSIGGTMYQAFQTASEAGLT